jgi:hypothetical protein
MLSRTAASGKPTITVFGSRAGAVSTSTSTGTASMPSNAKVRSWASMGHLRESVQCSVFSQNDRSLWLPVRLSSTEH